MASFSISEAQLVALFLEAVFWGMFFIMFIISIQTLLFKDATLKKSSAIHWPLLCAAVAMFFIGTLDLAVGLYHNIRAFIQFTGEGGSDAEFTQISDWVNVLKLANTLVQSIIGDGILVYRCWVVFSRRWYAIGLSVILWLVTTGCSIAALYFAGTLHSNDTVNAGKLQPLITSFLASSIALNIVTTSLIVYRIWRVDQSSRRMNAASGWGSTSQLNRAPAVPQPPTSRLRHAMFVMVESGALYTGTAIITFATYLSGSNSSYATSDVEVQIVGIAFSMIIIRAASNTAEMATTSSQNVPLSVIDRSQHVQILVRRDIEQSKADEMVGSKQFSPI